MKLFKTPEIKEERKRKEKWNPSKDNILYCVCILGNISTEVCLFKCTPYLSESKQCFKSKIVCVILNSSLFGNPLLQSVTNF